MRRMLRKCLLSSPKGLLEWMMKFSFLLWSYSSGTFENAARSMCVLSVLGRVLRFARVRLSKSKVDNASLTFSVCDGAADISKLCP
jgi:hypothetical protein